jgi:hypothetical protein
MMKATYIAIILAQIPVVVMLYLNRGKPPKVKKQKRRVLLVIEFTSVIIALIIASIIKGRF